MRKKQDNPRQISKVEYARLQADLERFGDLGGIVHNETTDSLVGGNQRASVFDLVGKGAEIIITEEHAEPTRTGETARGYVIWKGERFDYRRVRWDKATEDAACLVANRDGGTWDFDVLSGWGSDLLKDTGFDADMLATTNDLAANLALMLEAEKEPPKGDTEPQIDKAEELREKWGVELGQLWQLGEHRVICGDCTDPAVVDAVSFGDAFDLVCTDPPYGVSYADKNEYLNAVAKGNRIQTPIANDHLTVDEVSDLWRKAFTLLFEHTKLGGVYYINSPQGGDLMMMMMMMLREAGWLLKPQIIWVKNNHVLGRSDYQLKHEPVLYGWKPGDGHYWCGSRSEMSVWFVDKPQNSDMHPTTKPVELIEKAIANSSKPGEIVADFFLGSGTTLIAAHNLGRKCRGIEIVPAYVAVTLQRFKEHTGIEPVLLG